MIDVSSKWLTGRSVTIKCDIIHTNSNYLKLSNQMIILLQNVNMHSYVPSNIFLDLTLISPPSMQCRAVPLGLLKSRPLFASGMSSRKLLAKFTNMSAVMKVYMVLNNY